MLATLLHNLNCLLVENGPISANHVRLIRMVDLLQFVLEPFRVLVSKFIGKEGSLEDSFSSSPKVLQEKTGLLASLSMGSPWMCKTQRRITSIID